MSKNTVPGTLPHVILDAEDFDELAQTLPPFLRPADLQRLYGIGRSEANLMAHQIGCVRFGSRGKLLRIPKRAVLRDLKQRATCRDRA